MRHVSLRSSAAILAAAVLFGSACTAGESTSRAEGSPSPSPPSDAGTTATGSPAPEISEHLPHASVAWSDCGGGFQCGTLTAPLDYSDTHGRKIGISVIRRPASDPSQRIGSLVLDPGGPGASGVEWLRNVWQLFGSLSARFDLVAFDPRGVATSSPVRCLDDPHLEDYFKINPVPTSSQEKRRWVAANKRYDAACVRGDKPLLSHVATRDTAMDMELLRRAVGDSKLTYMGFSYGTFLGEMYASLFPAKVRALALDAVLPPRLTTTQLILGQTRGFAQDLHDFFDWCRANGCSLASSGDPEAAFDDLVTRLQEHAMPATETRTLVLGEATYGVADALYDSRSWPTLSAALSAAIAGDGSRLLALFDDYAKRDANGHYSNEFDAYNAIICVDRPSPRSTSRYGQLADRLKKRYGTFGSFIAWQSLPCAYWPVPPAPLPSGLDSHKLAPILYVGGTHDPATPYSWAKQAHHETRGSVLLTRIGEGHTSYGKSTCVHDAVDSYLIDLNLPPRHERCTGI